MSTPPQVRRTDRLMSDERAREIITGAYAGRLGTVGEDGWPYVLPLLYVWMTDQIWLHNTRARGHLRSNIDHETKVCFEVDVPGEVFAYGRFECDSSVAYHSVIAFGRIRIIEDEARKKGFFDAFMAKYSDPNLQRPAGFYPRLHEVTVYAITIERMTGKELALPAVENQWPAVDLTKTPNAVP